MRDLAHIIGRVDATTAETLGKLSFQEAFANAPATIRTNPNAENIWTSGYIVGWSESLRSLIEALTADGYVIVPRADR